jgi:hypothetical protein
MDRALTALFSDVTSSAFEEKYQDSLEPCVLLDHAQHALDGRVFSHDLFSLMTEEKFKFIASYLGKCTEKRFSDIYEFDYQVRFSFVLGAARCWSDKQFIINNFRKILPYIHDRPSVIKYIESSGSNGYYRELLQANTEYERELKAQSYSNSESEHGQVIGNSHNILDEL